MGWIKNPKKAAYNKIYNKTTFSFRDILKYNKKKASRALLTPLNNSEENEQVKSRNKGAIIAVIIAVLAVFGAISGAVQDSKEKSESNTTTIVERAIVDLSEENSEEMSTENTTIATTTEKTTVTTTKAMTTEAKTTTVSNMTYILNTSSMKFHYQTCRGVKDMKDENKKEFTGDRQEVIDMGYSPCGICHP